MLLCVEVGTRAGRPGPRLIPGAQSPQRSVSWPFPSVVGTEITEFIYSCGLCAPMLLECDVSMETDQDALDLRAQAGWHEEITCCRELSSPRERGASYDNHRPLSDEFSLHLYISS